MPMHPVVARAALMASSLWALPLWTSPAQAGWTNAAPVEKLRLEANGDAVATLNRNASLPKCARKLQVRLASDNPEFDTIYIRMLAAYLAYQNVSLDIGESQCAQGQPRITGIKIDG